MQDKTSTLRTKLTPVQLQQRLIYTQAELNKYKAQVEKYQNDYYYNMIDELKTNEQQWTEEKESLQVELHVTRDQLQQLQSSLDARRQREKEMTEEKESLQVELHTTRDQLQSTLDALRQKEKEVTEEKEFLQVELHETREQLQQLQSSLDARRQKEKEMAEELSAIKQATPIEEPGEKHIEEELLKNQEPANESTESDSKNPEWFLRSLKNKRGR